MTHTLEVSQISRTIARALRLNEDLTEAIALGHDLGHTPFGHNGESILNRLLKDGFRHNEQSLRVVDILAKHKEEYGLNLTMEVRDGILNHTGATRPFTLEGQIVKISDRIAYLNHDIDDAERAGLEGISEIPTYLLDILGHTHGERINTMILDIITNSTNKDEIIMSDGIYSATMELRKFMFEKIYTNDIAKSEDRKAEKILSDLFNHYMDNIDEIPNHGKKEGFTDEEIVKDYIAGMTDTYVIKQYRDIFLPLPWDKY